MADDPRLGGRPRTRCKAIVRARRQPCAMCGYPIDQTAQRMGRRHPLASVVDEWLPRRLGGDPHDPDNCVELHHRCNEIKAGTWPVTPNLMAQCRAEIERILNAATVEVRHPW